MGEEANEHAQQAEANVSKKPPAPPEFDPDPALVEVSLKSDANLGFS